MKGMTVMKKTMKKMCSVMLSAVMAVSLLSACGKDDGKVSIHVGSWPTEGKKLETYTNYHNTFIEKYGTEQYEIVPDEWKYDVQTFLMKAASKQLPNLFTAYFTDADRLKNSGYGKDLTEILKKAGYYENINPQVADILGKDGKIYAIPTNGYVLGLMFNAKLFKEAGLVNADGSYKAPKTWDEVVEFAKIIKEKTGKAGFVLEAADNTGGWLFTNIAWSFGVDFMEEIDGKWQATFDTEECVNALQWVKDLKWKHDVVPSNIFLSQQQTNEIFATDQVGMVIASPAAAKTVAKNFKMSKDNVGEFSMPAGPEKRVALLGGNIAALSNISTDEQAELALKWLEVTGSLPMQEIDDAFKAAKELEYQNDAADGLPIGAKEFQLWRDTPINALTQELVQKYKNVDDNLFADYNASVTPGSGTEISIQPEEPVCCQDLYGLLTSCLQEVLTNENADCKELIANAAKDFQVNYLDKQANK